MTENQPTALVTGASAGIGRAFCRLLAAEGYHIVMVARREARLRELAQEIDNSFTTGSTVIAADLSRPDAANEVCRQLVQHRLSVDLLVNNAGFSIRDGFCDTDWQVHRDEIQLMVTTLTQLCHRLAAAMRERGQGHIINVSSLAAFVPTAPSFLYTAIKSYVLHFSEALDMELKPHGVHVTALCPGFTWSEFHDVMGNREKMNRLPKFIWSTPEEVAEAGYRAVLAGKPVCMPGVHNKVTAAFARLLPEAVRYRIGRKADL